MKLYHIVLVFVIAIFLTFLSIAINNNRFGECNAKCSPHVADTRYNQCVCDTTRIVK